MGLLLRLAITPSDYEFLRVVRDRARGMAPEELDGAIRFHRLLLGAYREETRARDQGTRVLDKRRRGA